MKNGNVLVVGVVLAIVFTFTVALADCGNESGTAINTTSTPTPTPTPGSVTITCVDHIQIGVQSPTTYTCKASETVTWSVNNASLATISTTGVLTPNTTITGDVTVTATATTGSDTAATATVKVVDWILYATNSGRFLMNPTEPA